MYIHEPIGQLQFCQQGQQSYPCCDNHAFRTKGHLGHEIKCNGTHYITPTCNIMIET